MLVNWIGADVIELFCEFRNVKQQYNPNLRTKLRSRIIFVLSFPPHETQCSYRQNFVTYVHSECLVGNTAILVMNVGVKLELVILVVVLLVPVTTFMK